MIIDKKHKVRIVALHDSSKKNAEQEVQEFAAICKEIGIEIDSEDSDSLFDYIFNETKWTVKFK